EAVVSADGVAATLAGVGAGTAQRHFAAVGIGRGGRGRAAAHGTAAAVRGADQTAATAGVERATVATLHQAAVAGAVFEKPVVSADSGPAGLAALAGVDAVRARRQIARHREVGADAIPAVQAAAAVCAVFG